MPSLIHRFPFLADLLRSRATQPTPTPQRLPAMAPNEPRSNYPELEEARGEAMRRMFPKLYSWCASRREWSLATEAHAYLGAATSLEDLERRIRVIERRRPLQP